MANPEALPFEDTTNLRGEVIETCLLLRDKLGYIIGTSGNVSVRVEDGVLVTPSRMKYDDVKPEDLVVVGWDGRIARGHRLPTSECEMHRRLMLDRPDFGALIHTHSPWASICACAGRSIPVLSDDMAEIIGGEIQCSRHVPSGKHREMTAAVREAIGPDACAVLLGNHGAMAGGRSLEEAVAACQVVEKSAMTLVLGQALGGVQTIPEEAWRWERDRYLNRYGKPEDLAEIVPPPGEEMTGAG